MKNALLLAGILLPFIGFTQTPDSNRQSKFLTAAPRLGGITLTDAVTPIKVNGAASMVQQHILDIGLPLYKDFTSAHPVFIKSGFRYENLIVPNIAAFGSGAFHAFTVPLLASYSLSRKTNLTFIGLATLSSDLKQAAPFSDLQYTLGLRIGFQPGKQLRYGVTLTYVNSYSGQLLIPVPDLDWTINRHLQLTAVVPSRISLKYKLTANQSLGLTSGYTASTYGLTDGKSKEYLSWQQYSGGLIYDLKLGGRWNINLVAGHSFLQRLETFDQSEKASFDNFSELNKRKPVYSNRQTSFVFQAVVTYQF
jgi:Domain of unknown function (DUF6268)